MADSRKFQVSVEVTRNYGLHSIKFALSENVTVNNGQERRDAFASLMVQLTDQISLYESIHLPELRLPSVSNQHEASSPNNFKKVKATQLVVESKGGKRYLSVKGGEYTKFGVAIYPECDTAILLDEYDYGVHDLTPHNLDAVIEIVDGKPRRVVSLK
jgi:hypothetical protein